MEEKKKVNAYQKLIDGIEKIVNEGQYREFLKSMKKFHSYSFNNRLLIFAQNPEATRVAGYCTWKSLGRGVKSKPQKIFILHPMHCKVKKEENDGKEEMIDLLRFGWSIVYDISDTYLLEGAKEIPLVDSTELNNNSSQDLYEILLQLSPVKVDIEATGNGAVGYYSESEKRIVISPTLSQDDKTATLLHEIAHSLYDDFDYSKDRDLSEIFVESVAFITADYFGLDTSKCSFSYITKWSKGDSKKLIDLGSKIQETSDKFIENIQKQLDHEINMVA